MASKKGLPSHNKRWADELRQVADIIETGGYVSVQAGITQDWKYRLSAPDGRPYIDRKVYNLEVVFIEGGYPSGGEWEFKGAPKDG